MTERVGEAPPEQLALVRDRIRRSAPERVAIAAQAPVARVAVDIPLAHLDRPFDYLVREPHAADAVPGARVRVRFAGQDVNGYVLERAEFSEHVGRLQPLRAVVSAEAVLAPQVVRLARAVADRYAGTLADVLRLAIPPRHARVEREQAARTGQPVAPPAGGAAWRRYRAGPAFVDALGRGESPRAVWSALPGEDWAAAIADAVHRTLAAGRGALVVVPDGRDVRRVTEGVAATAGAGSVVALTAELGPAERYRRWLAVRRGVVRAVVGTRAAMFAPVADLGLVVVWDDGDDLHAEPRAPYPHVREVLALRSAQEHAALLVGGHARTAEAQLLVDSGWARPIMADRATVRTAMPRVVALGAAAELARDEAAASARLPTAAWEIARVGLRDGPVLVQVPRRGYVPTIACGACRSVARCPACAGPLALPGRGRSPACRWCGHELEHFSCQVCAGTTVRAVVVGARRTAEELGRAFPAVRVVTSGRDDVVARVPSDPVLVVATPGAEPIADGGYAAALLLDGWALLGRADLRAGEEALRRWLAAAALVRPASAGGAVAVHADAGLAPVQALVRWDPATAADRELSDRKALGFPPAVRIAEVTGPSAAVAELLATGLPQSVQQVGPGPGESTDDVRVLLRVPLPDAASLAAALRAGQAIRSARKSPHPLRVRIDPVRIG